MNDCARRAARLPRAKTRRPAPPARRARRRGAAALEPRRPRWPSPSPSSPPRAEAEGSAGRSRPAARRGPAIPAERRRLVLLAGGAARRRSPSSSLVIALLGGGDDGSGSDDHRGRRLGRPKRDGADRRQSHPGRAHRRRRQRRQRPGAVFGRRRQRRNRPPGDRRRPAAARAGRVLHRLALPLAQAHACASAASPSTRPAASRPLPDPGRTARLLAGGAFDQIEVSRTSDAAYQRRWRAAKANKALPRYTGEHRSSTGEITGPIVEAGDRRRLARGISLPGFMIPAGSSCALTARSTSIPVSPTSASM